MRHLIVTLLSIATLWVHGPVQAADNPDKAREQAKVLYEVGMTAVEEGRYADAANTFDQAYRLHPNVILLWNAARAHHRAEQFQKARDRYRACLAEDDLPPKRRQQAADYMVEVEMALREANRPPPPTETVTPPPAPPEDDGGEVPGPPSEPAEDTTKPPAEPTPETTDDESGPTSPLETVVKAMGRGVVKAASSVEKVLSGEFGVWDEGGSSWHRHEQLFVRLGLGVGGGHSSLEGTFETEPRANQSLYTVAGDFESSSLLMDLALQAGMNLSEGWVVHADLALGGYTHQRPLEIQQERVDGEDEEADPEAGLFDFAKVQARNLHIGVGSTLYLLPLNLYVGGGIGITQSTLVHRSRDHRSPAGFGMYLSTGKDWWIDDEISVGVGLRLHAGWTDQPTDTPWTITDDAGEAHTARLTRPSDFTMLYGVLSLNVTYD